MPNTLQKHPFITLATVLIIGLLVWGFWPQAVLVEVKPASYAPLTISIEEEGRTRVIDRYIISAPVNGVTCRQKLKVGDAVEQGQILLNITPLEPQVLDLRSRAQAEAKVSAARSALHAAEEQALAASAAAELASNEHIRLKPLMEQGMVTREAYDKAATLVQTTTAAQRSAKFNIEVANYELQAARTTLQYSAGDTSKTQIEKVPVRSPVSGKILKLVRTCEGPVRTGDPLLEVGDPSALEIEVDVLSADAVKINPGMKVLFERWGGDQLLEGVVHNIEPVGFTKVSALGVEEQRVLIISSFTSAAELWQRLGDGYRVEARFVLWQQDDVLQIPASSLFRYNNGWAVFVVQNGRASRRQVTVGQRNGLIAQIIYGIKEGEVVINHPSDQVEDKRRVMVRLIE